jgi:hypothetical protein
MSRRERDLQSCRTDVEPRRCVVNSNGYSPMLADLQSDGSPRRLETKPSSPVRVALSKEAQSNHGHTDGDKAHI